MYTPYAYADIRVVEQTDATTSTIPPTGAYTTQTFTVATTTEVHSFAIGDGGCGGSILNAGLASGFNFSSMPLYFYGFDSGYFPIQTPIAGGWQYSGGSYTLTPGNIYYFSEGCNNGAVTYTGSATDIYPGGEAGILEGIASPIPTFRFYTNAFLNRPLRDLTFTVCSDNDCTLAPPATTTPPCTVDCFDNVLFIPGVEASKLYRDDGTANGNKLWEPHGDSDGLGLMMNPDGTSIDTSIYAHGLLDNAYVPVKGNVYASFIDDMNNLVAAGKINAWAPAPYDWRLTLDQILNNGSVMPNGGISYLTATDSPYIIQKLKSLAKTSKTGKVTIIAHSNGGLVAKALMQRLGTDAAIYVDKMIFVASPQVGTPSAITSLLHGYDQALPVELAHYGLSDAAARQAGDTMPGLYNLLPSAAYFTSVNDRVIRFSPTTLPVFVTQYGTEVHSANTQNIFLSDSTRSNPAIQDLLSPTKLSATFIAQSVAVHQLLDSWVAPSGVQVIQIAGWGIPTTVTGVNYTQEIRNGIPQIVPAPQFAVDGDGTVVVPSALWMSTSSGALDYWVDLKKYNGLVDKLTTGHIFKASHPSILEVKKLLDFIDNEIKGTRLPLSSYSYLTDVRPRADGTLLRYSLHSPLTLNLFDNLGRHTGVSTTTGQVDEEIPGTYYTEFGDVKYIFTDATDPTHILMQGYATGTFTLAVEQLVGNTITASTTWRDIPTTPSTIVNTGVTSDITTITPLIVDLDGNGLADFTITPKANDSVTIPPPKIPLTVTAVSKTIIKGSPIPALTASTTGFVAGTPNDVTGTPLCKTTATATSTVGTYPITCTIGTLSSNNYTFTTFVAGTVKILYRCDEFSDPINSRGHEVRDEKDDSGEKEDIRNSPSVFKVGSTVPVKFEYRDINNLLLSATTSPLWYTPQKGASTAATVDESLYTDPSDSGIMYQQSGSQYKYNWKTTGLTAGYWYRLYAKLGNGQLCSVTVGLK